MQGNSVIIINVKAAWQRNCIFPDTKMNTVRWQE